MILCKFWISIRDIKNSCMMDVGYLPVTNTDIQLKLKRADTTFWKSGESFGRLTSERATVMTSSRDRHSGTLLSFHADERNAIETAQCLRRNRIRRAVLVHRSADGIVRKDYVTPRYGALWGPACGSVLGIVAGYLILGLRGPLNSVVGYVAILLAFVAGACGGWLVVYFLKSGVAAGLVEKYARRLVGG
jgi:hypothetical protein